MKDNSYHQTYTADYEQALRLLEIPSKVDQTLLDAGAGIGRSVLAASLLGLNSLRISLVDLNYPNNQYMFQRATHYAGERHEVLPGNYLTLDFPVNSFDFTVLCGPPQIYAPEVKADTIRSLTKVTKYKIGVHDLLTPANSDEIQLVEGVPLNRQKCIEVMLIF